MKLIETSKVFIKRNASTILTCVGAAGVVATGISAVRATPKALTLLENAKQEKGEDLTKMETALVAAPVYIPAVLIGSATIACIFGANILNQRQQAALMSAYALLDNSYKEYRNKVKELHGDDADKEIREEVMKDKYANTEISFTDDKRLYYDAYSERYFKATAQQVMYAEHAVNRILNRDYGLYLNEYFELLGLEITDYGNYMGWSSSEMMDCYWDSWLEFEHEKVIMPDGLECTIIHMSIEPTFGWENY